MQKIVGINPVREALKVNKDIIKLEIYENIKQNNISDIIKLAKQNKISIVKTKKREDRSQGVAVYIENYDYLVPEGEFLEKIAIKDESIVLILDQIKDPGNLGALIRSSEAFGVDGIVIPERRSAGINETVIKTSTGAIEHIDIVEVTNISKFIDKIKKIDFWVYAAEADSAIDYKKEKYPKKSCLVLGSEGQGIRRKVKEHCDIKIKIPMVGKVNSLNVSVAGGILLSEISNK
ncbi:MAG: 23S rRNA (guanosine(2251)-2'-O)-methyltransferase RlmB [Fusobacteriota bacterium]